MRCELVFLAFIIAVGFASDTIRIDRRPSCVGSNDGAFTILKKSRDDEMFLDDAVCNRHGRFQGKSSGVHVVRVLNGSKAQSRRVIFFLSAIRQRRLVLAYSVSHVEHCGHVQIQPRCSSWRCRFWLRDSASMVVSTPSSHVLMGKDFWNCSARLSVVLPSRVYRSSLPTHRHVEPLHSVSQLLLHPSSPLPPARSLSLPFFDRNSLMVVHDFANNYCWSDSALDIFWGRQAQHQYSFVRWAHVGTFTFFTHARVSIPPRGWVRAARANAGKTAVLGTVMSESSDETRMLMDNAEAAALQLARIAHQGQFDGWFINLESRLERKENLALFLTVLRKYCVVVLYDSIDLEYHNKLSKPLKDLLDCCVDAVFLNYQWLPSFLPRRMENVFVGVDVYGRGMYHSGGYKSGATLKLIRSRQLSGGLFAPGWATQIHGNEEADEQLWTGCEWRKIVLRVQHLEHITLGSPGSMTRVVVEVRLEGESCPIHFRLSVSGNLVDNVQMLLPQSSRGRQTHTVTMRGLLRGQHQVTVEASSSCAIILKSHLRYSDSSWPCKDGILDGELVVVEFPNVTHFCIGKGNMFWMDGVLFRQEPWANMGFQDRLPSLRITASYLMELTLEKAFSFGSSLKLVALDKDVPIPLFRISSTARRVRLVSYGRVEVVNHTMKCTNVHSWIDCATLTPVAGIVQVKLPDQQAFVGLAQLEQDLPCPCQIRTARMVSKSLQGCLYEWEEAEGTTLDLVSLNLNKTLARLPSGVHEHFDEHCDDHVEIRINQM